MRRRSSAEADGGFAIDLGVFTQPLRTHAADTVYRPADTPYPARCYGTHAADTVSTEPLRYPFAGYRIGPPIRQPTNPATRSASVARIHFFRTLFSTDGPQRSAPQHPHRSPCHRTSARTVPHRPHRRCKGSAARYRLRGEAVGPMTRRATACRSAPWHHRVRARARCFRRARVSIQRGHRTRYGPAGSGCPQSGHRYSALQRMRYRSRAGRSPSRSSSLSTGG